ncbi:MAG: hypothetical protein ACK4P4_17250 [Allorhizobium sp.]
MSNTTDLVAELVRAANEVEKLTAFEHRRLFTRTITIVGEMRQSINIPTGQADADKIVELQLLVAAVGAMATEPEEIREALLTAAGMIRDLRIVLDTAIG